MIWAIVIGLFTAAFVGAIAYLVYAFRTASFCDDDGRCEPL